MLTGRCKKDFFDWYFNSGEYNEIEVMLFFDDSDISKKAYYTEFFDSKGINIIINNLDYQNWWWYDVKYFPNTIEGKKMYDSRQKTITEGIKEANKIYNGN